MAHARRRLPDKEALFDRMRESIELPLLDSSLQPRIALARVNDQAQLDGLKCGFRLYNSLQQVCIVMCAP